MPLCLLSQIHRIKKSFKVSQKKIREITNKQKIHENLIVNLKNKKIDNIIIYHNIPTAYNYKNMSQKYYKKEIKVNFVIIIFFCNFNFYTYYILCFL